MRLFPEQTQGYLIIVVRVYFIHVCKDDRPRVFDDRPFKLSIMPCRPDRFGVRFFQSVVYEFYAVNYSGANETIERQYQRKGRFSTKRKIT